MAVITIDEVCTGLGLDSDTLDEETSAKLDMSITMAQRLVESYIKGPIEETPQEYDQLDVDYVHRYYLPHHPVVSVEVFEKDGAPFTDYRLDKKAGALVFGVANWPRGYGGACLPWASSLHVEYTSGWETCPDDLHEALLNISIAIYTQGGNLSGSGVAPTGALKSMTMFDAMSMSFEVPTGAVTQGDPAGLLAQWSFVLDQYKMEGPVLA